MLLCWRQAGDVLASVTKGGQRAAVGEGDGVVERSRPSRHQANNSAPAGMNCHVTGVASPTRSTPFPSWFFRLCWITITCYGDLPIFLSKSDQ